MVGRWGDSGTAGEQDPFGCQWWGPIALFPCPPLGHLVLVFGVQVARLETTLRRVSVRM